MKADMHVHTLFSVDGKSSMEEHCKRALEKGITHICFTEHVDFNKFEYARWQFDAKAYFNELERLRKEYKELTILSGMEFSEPHLYVSEFNRLESLPFDNIIASIHHCKNELFPAPKNLSMEQASQEYYELMLKTVEFGKFQTLAHMDFPKRFFDEWLHDRKTIDEILQILIDKKIALEVNTAIADAPNFETMPKYSIIERYAELGGKSIVMGSDAHHEDNLSKSFESVERLLPKCLVRGYFREKEFHPLNDDDGSGLDENSEDVNEVGV